MYPADVKAITITISEDLDARAAAEIRRLGISKSALIRLGLAAVLPVAGEASSADLWRDLAGFGGAGLGAAPGEIDEVVYRP
jgi:hypothetical protein